MKPEIVLFDAGETLLHPDPSWEWHFGDECRSAGLDVDAGRLAGFLRKEIAHFATRLRETSGGTFSLDRDQSVRFWTQLYHDAFGELGVAYPQDLPGRLYRRFSEFETYGLFPDVGPAFDAIEERGYRIGLISNFEDWLEDLLVHLEVRHRLEVCVVSGRAGVEKPDPEIFRIALDLAGVAPGDALYVGDSLEADVEGAGSVGMSAVLLDRHDAHPAFPGPSIQALTALAGLLD